MRIFTGSNKKRSSGRVSWVKAPDIKKRVSEILKTLDLEWVEEKRIYCFRSENSKTKAYARIWGLSRIFQLALDIKPAYVIEVISERFDNLSEKEKDEILIHEIAHIPKTFSGSLLPHFKKGKRKFDDKVHLLHAKYKKGENK